jgi:hypothetical protein
VTERSPADQAAIRFLLRRMTDEESRGVELRLLEDREAFEAMMAAEDDLIDAYLDGGLVAEERRQFERAYFGSPDRRARVDFARALREKLGRERPTIPRAAGPGRTRRPSREVWLAAAAVVFGAAAVFFAASSSRHRAESARALAAKKGAESRLAAVSSEAAELRGRAARLERELTEQRAESSGLADQVAALRAQGGRVASFVLAGRPGGSGAASSSSSVQTLRVPSDAALVRLSLPFNPGGSYASYRAVLQSSAGKGYWAGTGSWPARGTKTVTVAVPAASLPPGDYVLSLTGVAASGDREPAADFSFRVTRG